MLIQQVLIMCTENPGFRCKAFGWDAEDPRGFVAGNVSLTPGPDFKYDYNTPLEALANGWKLLAPPNQIEDDFFEWHFVREVRD